MNKASPDPLVPPAWQIVDELVERMVPRATRHDEWWDLTEAISNLVYEVENNAVKRHGQVILAAIFGETFQQMSETSQEWGQ